MAISAGIGERLYRWMGGSGRLVACSFTAVEDDNGDDCFPPVASGRYLSNDGRSSLWQNLPLHCFNEAGYLPIEDDGLPLSLLDWRPPAEVVPFPFHRSHGATIAVSRSIVDLETAKRSGRLNSLRAQTRKRLEPLIGFEAADKAADDLIRGIKIGFAYCENFHLQKQRPPATVISFSTGERVVSVPHSYGAGRAGALGQGAKLLAGLGGAHEKPEYDAAHAREEGAA